MKTVSILNSHTPGFEYIDRICAFSPGSPSMSKADSLTLSSLRVNVRSAFCRVESRFLPVNRASCCWPSQITVEFRWRMFKSRSNPQLRVKRGKLISKETWFIVASTHLCIGVRPLVRSCLEISGNNRKMGGNNCDYSKDEFDRSKVR